mmetsp:Transcript_35659/g.6423  ORF Transcript_35659/g.6423 Transcript_35659/m.6423 type:complete len:87 (-) Transcript_35659:2607-2867(-)
MLLLVHGALRGAVGLSLALIIAREEDLSDRVRILSLFHTAGIAVITLLLNAPTTGLLIDKLGLAKSSKVQESILSNIVEAIMDNTS